VSRPTSKIGLASKQQAGYCRPAVSFIKGEWSLVTMAFNVKRMFALAGA
jgi:hypothetical protein